MRCVADEMRGGRDERKKSRNNKSVSICVRRKAILGGCELKLLAQAGSPAPSLTWAVISITASEATARRAGPRNTQNRVDRTLENFKNCLCWLV
jgi:hypothetical protein